MYCYIQKVFVFLRANLCMYARANGLTLTKHVIKQLFIFFTNQLNNQKQYEKLMEIAFDVGRSADSGRDGFV